MSQETSVGDYDIVEVDFVAKMTNAEAQKALNSMMNKWQITSSDEKKLMKNSLLVWLAMNGASPRADYYGVQGIPIHGNVYPLSVVVEVVGADVRKFARAFANDTKKILKNNVDIANKLAKKHGVQMGLGHVCFDTSDFCDDNTEAESAVIARLKRLSIATSSKYNLVKHQNDVLMTNVPPEGPAAPAGRSYYGDNEF